MVLLAFSLNTAGNAFMFMDFTTLPDITKDAFDLCANCSSGDQTIAWTYSASLVAVLPAAIPVILYLNDYNWVVSFIGTAMNTMGAWTRYLAVLYKSPTLAIVSSIFVGLSAAVIICSYTAITLRWFPPEQRTFACSLAVQSNYAGWCLGAVVIPYLVRTPEHLKSLQYYQAIILSAVLGVFLLCHRDRPKGRPIAHAEHMSLVQATKKLATNGQFVLQCFCYAMLAGVSFAVPAFQASALGSINLTNQEAAWTNFSFIICGVVTGLTLGALNRGPSRFAVTIKAMFIITSVALIALNALTLAQAHLTKATLYPLLVVFMGMCGASSLGFIGVALSAAVESTFPVDGEYSGFLIEWWLQIFAAIITQVATSAGTYAFVVCGVATWVTTLLVVVFYKQDLRKTLRSGWTPLVQNG